MPRRTRFSTPTGVGLRSPSPTPIPRAVPTDWQSTLGSYAQQYGPHVLPGILSTLQGGLGAYNVQNPQQQIPQQGFGTTVASVLASKPPAQGEQPVAESTPMTPQEPAQPRLSDLLYQLVSNKLDMMGNRGSMGPSYPDRLYSGAFQASDSQLGSPQGPPQYRPMGPQFAFDQNLGGGAQYNPMAALGDFSTPQAPQQQKPWYRAGANQLGSLLQGLAPLAGQYGGPAGIVGGAGLGALGYGLQQF